MSNLIKYKFYIILSLVEKTSFFTPRSKKNKTTNGVENLPKKRRTNVLLNFRRNVGLYSLKNTTQYIFMKYTKIRLSKKIFSLIGPTTIGLRFSFL